ncbi:hypothetical protein OIU84_014728 [Salix udensis]|uniref:Uncharacterized protein n=1 Tax=Salix udensis TaxID=889485 RepID=A0AAD6JEE0_9ROSI|nr:hypothetical protein OIU84_014728 [Salix udensis]
MKEGLERKSKEESKNDSRIARMNARARKNGSRAKRTHRFVVTGRRRKARSNSTKRRVETPPNKEACMVKDQGKKVDNNAEVMNEIIDDEPVPDVAVILDPEAVDHAVADQNTIGEVIIVEGKRRRAGMVGGVLASEGKNQRGASDGGAGEWFCCWND